MSKSQPSNPSIQDTRIVQRSFVALVFVVVLLIVPFLHVYAVNVSNLQFPLSSIVTPVLGLAGVIFLFLWIVLLFLPSRLENKLQVFLLFVSVIAWLQTIFFVGDFGFLDGREPDWQAHRRIAYLQFFLQLLLMVFVVVRYQTISRNATFIAIMLLISSVFSLSPYSATFFGDRENKYAFNASQVFDFSNNKNTIVILVDTLQADIVNEIFFESSELKEAFNGFTFFRNSVSAFSKTYASVPALLSGTTFDNSTTLPSYLEETYRTKSLPAHLLKEGYDVRLHSFAPYSLVAHPEVAMNIVGTKGDSPSQKGMLQKDIVLLANMSLFKLVPHLIKPWIYNEGNFRVPLPPIMPIKANCTLEKENINVSKITQTFDAKFFDEFSQCASTLIDKPTFRYFHLSGAHAPFQFDKNFNYKGQQVINRKNFKAQSHGVLFQITSLFEKLKELEIYDDAIIVIAGDHGGGDLAVDLNFNQEGLPVRHRVQKKFTKQKIMGGIPGLLYKPAHSKKDFAISDAPVSLIDIAHTISDELGLNLQEFSGENLFEVESDSKRIRLHKYYEFGGWDIDYILPLTEFVIDGFSWFPESWTVSSRNLNIITDSSFKGLIVSMVEGGNLRKYDAEGWGLPQENGSKIKKGGATILLRKSFDEEVVLLMTHQSYPGSAGSIEEMTISLSGQPLGVWNFHPGDGQRKKTLVIPKALANQLQHVPLLIKSNQTESGIRIKEFRIETAEKYSYLFGEKIDFSNTGLGKKYQTFGWSTAEKWGSFSLGYRSGVLLKMTEKNKKDLELSIELDAILHDSWNEQNVRVSINGKDIAQLYLRDERKHSIVLRLGDNLLGQSEYVDLRFSYSKPIQPKMVGSSTDSRYLAIALKSIRLSKWSPDSQKSNSSSAVRAYKLIRTGEAEHIEDDRGKIYRLDSDAIQGYLDSVTIGSKTVRFSGWAVDHLNSKSKSKPKIILFSNGEQLVVRELNAERHDVASHFKNSDFSDSGYSFTLPLLEFQNANELKIFVLSDLGYVSPIVYRR